MTANVRPRGEDVRSFILRHVGSRNLSASVAQHFGITRQAVNRHLHKLTSEGVLLATGNTSQRVYSLAAPVSLSLDYEIADGLEEDVIWRKDVRPFLGALPDNVLEIWNWSFTEMFNNAIDHSGGKNIQVRISKTPVDTELSISDNGVGIFRKIEQELKLADERQAIFELSKGKLTTDRKNHSGQGIFFTSRMASGFDILSGGVYFNHELGREMDWILEREKYHHGTVVFLKVENHTSRTVRKTLNHFSAKGSYGFTKTVVPVQLAKYGTDQLVSRSQAKRVLMRVELFTQVIFDFSGVDTIGQAFADQIFRVFAQSHPEVKLLPSHANKEVMGIIQATLKAGRPGFKGKLA